MSKLISYVWKKNNKLFFIFLFIVCALSSQSAWLQSGITIAGNSAGTSGSDSLHLYGPIGLYYDETNNIIMVSDNGNYRVMQFSLSNPPSAGTVIAGNNGNGCGLNQFETTIELALDSYRQLYVSESSCNRVLKFPPNSISSTSGILIGSITNVQGLSLNPLTDDLYVASYSNNTVYRFARNSTSSVVVAGT
jgi:hypothetical protein